MAEEGIRALVVEDSITQALRLAALLQEHGIHADRAATGEEALDHLTHTRADLILIDFHLPSMRGDELCRQIRMNPATAHIPILMLTDDVQDVVERQGLESGADDHIPKSIAADGLMARINALLRNRRRGLPFELGAGLFQRHRVVAVDDSPTFLEHLRQELDHEGYEVTTFTDGERAFAAVSQGGCDCALVDLVMPAMDGIELCRRLDELRTRSGVWFPLLMVTGRDTKDDMMRALEAGADDFVSKSSDAAILRARIRALLRRKLQRDEHDRITGEFRRKELEVMRERTEREAAERRAALVEELEKANRDLRETQAQLIQAAKMASLGELVAGVAHEINNPLAFVMSHLDTVQRCLERVAASAAERLPAAHLQQFEKARTRLGDMRGGLERVRDLVTKLRTFSRLDEGEFKRVDVRESIESVLAILAHRLGDGIELRGEYAEDNVICCYPAPFNQLIMNLLNNAIDALGEAGRIDIRTERDAACFRLVVADSGPGLPPGAADRIFEPFFTTKPVGKGMGLGLAISYRIVQAHKGTIEARNREGGGAQFVVSIPLDLKEKSHGA